MERIAKLLFATVFVTIFAYVLFYWAMGYSGNGGEYWGYNGHVDARDAMQEAFERRDYRFLQLAIHDSRGRVVSDAPAYEECLNYPMGVHNGLRKGSSEPLHGGDSVRLAIEFAERYNEALQWHLAEAMDNQCEQVAESRTGVVDPMLLAGLLADAPSGYFPPDSTFIPLNSVCNDITCFRLVFASYVSESNKGMRRLAVFDNNGRYLGCYSGFSRYPLTVQGNKVRFPRNNYGDEIVFEGLSPPETVWIDGELFPFDPAAE